jgi:hypothetical protein
MTFIPTAKSRKQEFIEIADNTIAESERAFGLSSDPLILCAKGHLSFQKALVLIREFKVEDSKVEIQRALQGFRDTFVESMLAIRKSRQLGI